MLSGQRGAEEKEKDWVTVNDRNCPRSCGSSASWNSVLSVGLRVWCDHTDNQKVAALFFFHWTQSLLLCPFVSQLTVASPWWKEMQDQYLNENYPKQCYIDWVLMCVSTTLLQKINMVHFRKFYQKIKN